MKPVGQLQVMKHPLGKREERLKQDFQKIEEVWNKVTLKFPYMRTVNNLKYIDQGTSVYATRANRARDWVTLFEAILQTRSGYVLMEGVSNEKPYERVVRMSGLFREFWIMSFETLSEILEEGNSSIRVLIVIGYASGGAASDSEFQTKIYCTLASNSWMSWAKKSSFNASCLQSGPEGLTKPSFVVSFGNSVVSRNDAQEQRKSSASCYFFLQKRRAALSKIQTRSWKVRASTQRTDFHSFRLF